MFAPPISSITANAISSGGSPSGPPRYESPASPTTSPCGAEVARAKVSASRAKAEGSLTSGTYGRLGSISSSSAALQSSLASKLQARSRELGSTLFVLTWKESATPSGRPLPLLRASALRMGDTALGSWPTPCGQDGPNGGPSQGEDRLPGAASLASWPTTTTTRDWKDGSECPNVETNGLLGRVAWETLAPWMSPRARGDAAGSRWKTGVEMNLEDQARNVTLAAWNTPTSPVVGPDGHVAGNNRYVTSVVEALSPWSTPRANKRGFPDSHGNDERPEASGPTRIGSLAAAASGAPLNPEHSRWLMGLSIEWANCAPTETPSSFRRRSSSSKRPWPRLWR